MAGLLSPFLYSLPPVSSFLDLVAMAALRRRIQVLRKIWPDKPLSTGLRAQGGSPCDTKGIPTDKQQF
jgi:hypothetical protein